MDGPASRRKVDFDIVFVGVALSTPSSSVIWPCVARARANPRLPNVGIETTTTETGTAPLAAAREIGRLSGLPRVPYLATQRSVGQRRPQQHRNGLALGPYRPLFDAL